MCGLPFPQALIQLHRLGRRRWARDRIIAAFGLWSGLCPRSISGVRGGITSLFASIYWDLTAELVPERIGDMRSRETLEAENVNGWMANQQNVWGERQKGA